MNYNQIEVSAIKDYSHTAQLALCIEHIGAAMTALRVNNRVKSMPQFYQDYHNYSILCYAAHIGGTLEDRMADIVLGLVAFAKHNEIDMKDIEPYVEYSIETTFLNITRYVVYIEAIVNGDYPSEKTKRNVMAYLKLAICSCVGVCKQLNIDLPEHIRLKQEWLKTKDYE